MLVEINPPQSSFSRSEQRSEESNRCQYLQQEKDKKKKKEQEKVKKEEHVRGRREERGESQQSSYILTYSPLVLLAPV